LKRGAWFSSSLELTGTGATCQFEPVRPGLMRGIWFSSSLELTGTGAACQFEPVRPGLKRGIWFSSSLELTGTGATCQFEPARPGLTRTAFLLPPEVVLHPYDIVFVRRIIFIRVLPDFGYNAPAVGTQQPVPFSAFKIDDLPYT